MRLGAVQGESEEIMDNDYIPVPIHCRVRDAEEVVFIYPEYVDGKPLGRFNGCDHLFSGCPECKECSKEAFRILNERNT